MNPRETVSATDAELVVVGALRLELRALHRGAPGLALMRSGAGASRARRAAARLARHPARRVVVAGLCGALDPALSPGDVVVASRVVGPDAPARETEVEVICGALRDRGIQARVGPLVSSPRIVRGAEREALRRQGAIAVDMESAWLAQGVGDRPLAVVRVVMDGPRHELLRPATLAALLRGLGVLRRLAPALERWLPAGEPPRARASTAPAGLGFPQAAAV